MDPVSIKAVDLAQCKDFFYFTGGIVVIVLGGIGTILVLLGILQTRFLKPYKRKYPFKRFRNFKEFSEENPAGISFDPAYNKYLEEKLGVKPLKPNTDIPEALLNGSRFDPALKSRRKKWASKIIK